MRTRATIELAMRTGESFTVTPAMRRGVWAVTPTIDANKAPVSLSWNITHVPSGNALGSSVSSLRSARLLCRVLGERLPDFGSRARFGVIPTKTTGERWLLLRELIAAWRRGCL
ncbi:MAG TPA: hypothetical protein VHM19_23010 [Polyangiales bacterium]|jgi:inactivated superfamily I helicase|nr:hypothetical protein [Polyangiales bacterium]